MSFATKHAKNKLSSRLTRVYALLFSAIFFLLSCIVFLLAFRFLVQQQYDHLVNSLELYAPCAFSKGNRQRPTLIVTCG